jgi:methylated-DNA-[protein]-cysteine S-methyltransferase
MSKSKTTGIIRSRSFDTALGSCRICWSERGLTGVALLATTDGAARADHDAAGETPTPAWVRRAIELIGRHVSGAPQDLSALPLDTAGLPPFHRAVYEAARRIGPGRTASYGELAAAAGSPRASRAVGQALARNPFIVVVPCHRVLASGGRPGGFSAPGGLDTKARLLALEGYDLGRSPPAVAQPGHRQLAWSAGAAGSGPT